ncbi:bifunctional tetrahydrofolate synthase/dihydrofolate synthase [Aliidiomarina iranensis]|uniref:Dihydrofolate synthase/folylpolyglutamate synthase n=1 Tax=Aliidiomarina iranensis TaxID=1434071 RepID=A0A432VWZ8_9GAMM|nr:bifunctional tetrahydrofolate synthase/dihydrofolate synthase [Aliidiomarina iranensis]RUO21128.1 bifunctional tetrahydrofolate synthase/dihydrofolate synthase [Aliidiomarina iranensis]
MQAKWSLQQWLEYLEGIHHRPIDMGLERVRAVAETLDLLHPTAKVITVGGTNGKGSTVRYLEQMCLAAGITVATYTSPHLVKYTERVRVNGYELSEADHVQAFCAIEKARSDVSLTYFEFGTLAAVWLCQRYKPEVIVLEVGLGGRFDAVNIIDPDVSVVTSVGVDHIEFLGSDREQISFEKAGIYRGDKPAICGDPKPPQPLLAHARAIQAELYCVGTDFYATQTNESFDFFGPVSNWFGLPLPSLPFANALTALAAVQLSGLAVDANHAAAGLSRAQLTGRFEIVQTQPTVILDVGHNPHATEFLAQRLQALFANRRVVAVCGMLKDKEHRATLAPLKTTIKHWYLASLPGDRGTSAEHLMQALVPHAVANAQVTAKIDSELAGEIGCYSDPVAAFTQAKADVSNDDVIVCFGSFLTVAALQQHLSGQANTKV